MPLTQVQGQMLSGSTNTTTTIQSNGTTAMTIDSSQNVGIGTSSPGSKLHVKSTVDNTTNGLTLEYDVGTAYKSRVFTRGNDLYLSADTGNTGGGILFLTAGGTERAFITSGGNLAVGTSTPLSARVTVAYDSNNGAGITINQTNAASAGNLMSFRLDNVEKGSIYQNTSNTSYITSSDYRLKENITPMTGALAKVTQLKPVTYTWKIDGSDGQGFIAHELQTVVPDAVVGEKDAIDADGNPKYQGVDTSFLVATLTAAIQELKAIVDTQAAEIAALKAKV